VLLIIKIRALKIILKIAILNQNGSRTVGILLNIPHEISIPPKMEKGINIYMPVSIKKS
jgi:hypothetical protein